MIFAATTRQRLIAAMRKRGFVLVADLPGPTRIYKRRGVYIARTR